MANILKLIKLTKHKSYKKLTKKEEAEIENRLIEAKRILKGGVVYLNDILERENDSKLFARDYAMSLLKSLVLIIDEENGNE